MAHLPAESRFRSTFDPGHQMTPDAGQQPARSASDVRANISDLFDA